MKIDSMSKIKSCVEILAINKNINFRVTQIISRLSIVL